MSRNENMRELSLYSTEAPVDTSIDSSMIAPLDAFNAYSIEALSDAFVAFQWKRLSTPTSLGQHLAYLYFRDTYVENTIVKVRVL